MVWGLVLKPVIGLEIFPSVHVVHVDTVLGSEELKLGSQVCLVNGKNAGHGVLLGWGDDEKGVPVLGENIMGVV